MIDIINESLKPAGVRDEQATEYASDILSILSYRNGLLFFLFLLFFPHFFLTFNFEQSKIKMLSSKMMESKFW